ncbi:hypothetical protein [Nocardia sp.]|uniref:hypothetical protein n=1 Tax=Nocardia sp. TaxID=1821 RepID=UPI00260A815C|nr:hypothetical protein [Nocardia sp.]
MGTPEPKEAAPHTFTSLRDRVIEQYRQPFDDLLGTPEAYEQLGDFDTTFALAQLIGPIVFTKLTGLRAFTREDCTRLVDDFLRARSSGGGHSPGA